MTVKSPDAPADPHVPGVAVPLTEVTGPETRWGRGGTIVTVVADRRPVASVVPTARTLSPTHSAAKVGALTPLSLKVVDVAPTSTVELASFEAATNSPAVPEVPHVPDADEPLTEATVPDTRAGGGGITVTDLAATTSTAEMGPSARTFSPAQTMAKDGELTPFSEKLVEDTPTSTVKTVLLDDTVKSPAIPDVPQLPDDDEPFTDSTVPVTCPVGGGSTTTDVAVTVLLAERVPVARTLSPAQTMAKDGELTPFSEKLVEDAPTSTVNDVLLDDTAKSPGIPEVPQLPGEDEPLTEVTEPDVL